MSRYPKPAARAVPVVPFNEVLRYSVPEASLYLKQSAAQTWIDIRLGRLRVIREGSRTYVPGTEIVRRSRLPVTGANTGPGPGTDLVPRGTY